jgi:hypothetical protein
MTKGAAQWRESSLAVTNGVDVKTEKLESQSDDGVSRTPKAEKLLAIIRTDFRMGGTHKELQDRFLESTRQSESTFDRALRELDERGDVRTPPLRCF